MHPEDASGVPPMAPHLQADWDQQSLTDIWMFENTQWRKALDIERRGGFIQQLDLLAEAWGDAGIFDWKLLLRYPLVPDTNKNMNPDTNMNMNLHKY